MTGLVSDAYFGFSPCYNCLFAENTTQPLTAPYQLKIGTVDNRLSELWINGEKATSIETPQILSRTDAVKVQVQTIPKKLGSLQIKIKLMDIARSKTYTMEYTTQNQNFPISNGITYAVFGGPPRDDPSIPAANPAKYLFKDGKR